MIFCQIVTNYNRVPRKQISKLIKVWLLKENFPQKRFSCPSSRQEKNRVQKLACKVHIKYWCLLKNKLHWKYTSMVRSGTKFLQVQPFTIFAVLFSMIHNNSSHKNKVFSTKIYSSEEITHTNITCRIMLIQFI